jgi:hypothetical protein
MVSGCGPTDMYRQQMGIYEEGMESCMGIESYRDFIGISWNVFIKMGKE